MNGTLKQQGSHMIMTNVYKQNRKKYINIDSRFQDGYQTAKERSLASFTYTLPITVFNVKSITAKVVELPHSFYNFSKSAKNTFVIIDNSLCFIDDSYYKDCSALQAELNRVYNGDISFNIDDKTFKTTITSTSTSTSTPKPTIKWNVDEDGTFDRYNLRSKLGWCLGFREPEYTIVKGSIVSEGIVDISPFKYLYLVVDDFLNSNPSSFTSPMSDSLMNKRILARISVNSNSLMTGSFGSTIISNAAYNLVSDTRTYLGKMNLQRMKIELVNEWGYVMDLNYMPLSFCLEVEYE
jgi:hypothetical protein